MSKVICPYENLCSGCQLLHLTYEDQIDRKSLHLRELLQAFSIEFSKKIEFIGIQHSHLRDRLDFTLQNGRLGLFNKEHSEITDLPVCQQLSPELQSWLTEFRQIQWPFQRASFRLRVSHKGLRGVWIDAANIDIKTLLDEKNILRDLQKKSFVEIGQRRKIPVETAEGFKLRDPVLQPWFQTWCGDQPVDLYCHIASFTQPSLQANRAIADLISQWVKGLSRPRILEFGSGIGNLSFPALAHSQTLTACEIDELSLQGFRQSLEKTNWMDRVHIHAGDFQRKLTENFADFDLILCNPPRSGLMGFLKPLEGLNPEDRPQHFIYMSCFPESLCKDLQELTACGYEITKMSIVDQFPQTNHYEVLCLLQRK